MEQKKSVFKLITREQKEKYLLTTGLFESSVLSETDDDTLHDLFESAVKSKRGLNNMTARIKPIGQCMGEELDGFSEWIDNYDGVYEEKTINSLWKEYRQWSKIRKELVESETRENGMI